MQKGKFINEVLPPGAFLETDICRLATTKTKVAEQEIRPTI
jgi:hypothetical protein